MQMDDPVFTFDPSTFDLLSCTIVPKSCDVTLRSTMSFLVSPRIGMRIFSFLRPSFAACRKNDVAATMDLSPK